MSKSERVLALEIRSQRIGYVLFEDPKRLLDWGVMYDTKKPAKVIRKIRRLCRIFKPHIICYEKKKNMAGPCRSLVQLMYENSKDINISMHCLPHERFGKKTNTGRNKYERAQILASSFPEIAEHLPPVRKPWDKEPVKILVFDAAAVGIAYFNRHG